MVMFDMEYADAVLVEFALDEFIRKHKQRIHRLQTIPERSNAEKELIKQYENRVRNAKRVLGVVSQVL
jgi:hypothetical protein